MFRVIFRTLFFWYWAWEQFSAGTACYRCLAQILVYICMYDIYDVIAFRWNHSTLSNLTATQWLEFWRTNAEVRSLILDKSGNDNNTTPSPIHTMSKLLLQNIRFRPPPIPKGWKGLCARAVHLWYYLDANTCILGTEYTRWTPIKRWHGVRRECINCHSGEARSDSRTSTL